MCSTNPKIKIISGGQTGVDRAALDWAMTHGFDHGGWCPRGRRAEDGIIPDHYNLSETPSSRYAQRTEWNVRDSDATLILSLQPRLTGGSLLTVRLAEKQGRPWLHVHQALGPDRAVAMIRSFMRDHPVRVLNIAGSRASGQPGVGPWVSRLLTSAFGQ